jgi:hypothetical protein
MNMITSSTTTFVAIDPGKYKSVACVHEEAAGALRRGAALDAQRGPCRGEDVGEIGAL